MGRAMKTLAELQSLCSEVGLKATSAGRPSKGPYVEALRQHFWDTDNPGQPLPEQIEPMLLCDWNDLDPEEAQAIEDDHHAWCVQPKLDGCRVLVHVGDDSVRITGRTVSEVTFRLSEHQDNLPHLTAGLTHLAGTVLDGELVCPKAQVNTRSTVTATALQAVVAILATDPANAVQIQEGQDARLQLHAFDVLRSRGRDLTRLPLSERLAELAPIVESAANAHLHTVPWAVTGKRSFHDGAVGRGGEGTVWKRLDRPYEPGRRVRHWLKRKRSIEIQAFVSGFKPGSADRGNRQLIGAVEFSVLDPDGTARPVAWVSNWTDDERRAMTIRADSGSLQLNPNYIGRRAILVGQDESARCRRIRHARIGGWR